MDAKLLEFADLLDSKYSISSALRSLAYWIRTDTDLLGMDERQTEHCCHSSLS